MLRRKAGKGEFTKIAQGDVGALLHAHVFAEELTCAGAEDRQGKAGDVLIGAQGDGDKAEQQRGQRACQEGEEHGQQQRHERRGIRACELFIVERAAEAGRAAHEQDALDAEVHIAGFFGQNLAGGAKKEWGSVEYGSSDQADEVYIHDLSSFS